MKKNLNLLKMICICTLFVFSIGISQDVQSATTNVDSQISTYSSDKDVKAKETVICGKCGEIKGTKACCVATAKKCDGCKLIKGSPGCCKITKGTDAKLCPKCGEIKGDKKCCNSKAVKCPKCGLAKGSPGCCKIKK